MTTMQYMLTYQGLLYLHPAQYSLLVGRRLQRPMRQYLHHAQHDGSMHELAPQALYWSLQPCTDDHTILGGPVGIRLTLAMS